MPPRGVNTPTTRQRTGRHAAEEILYFQDGDATRMANVATVVPVHGPRVTSVQRGTESQAIAGGLDFAVEWLEDEADAEPKGETDQGRTP
jgi:hypothetical protein